MIFFSETLNRLILKIERLKLNISNNPKLNFLCVSLSKMIINWIVIKFLQ